MNETSQLVSLHVELNPEVFTKIKVACAINRITLKFFVERLLDNYFNGPQTEEDAINEA